MRHTYNGTPTPPWMPTAFAEGREDASSGSFRRFEQLYRHGVLNRALYRLGWLSARRAAVTSDKLDLAALKDDIRAVPLEHLPTRERMQIIRALGSHADMGAELERERVRLAGCGAAALGYADGCKPGDYGWSASLGDVLELRSQPLPSEVLFAFAAALTGRPEAVTFGAAHDAGEAARLVGAFCREHGFADPRDGWADALAARRERVLASDAEPG